MRLFTCYRCGNILYFENTKCVKCDATLGFDDQSMSMLALEPAPDGSNFIAIAPNAEGDAPGQAPSKWR